MKKHFRYIIVGSALLGVIATCASYKYYQRQADKKEAMLQLMVQSLAAGHFQPQNVDDIFSKKVFDLYLKRLDYNKKFFTQEDIKRLEQYKTDVDNEIQNGQFTYFEEASKTFTERLNDAEGFYKEILDKPMEFANDESFETDPKKLSYAANKQDMKEAWRKYLKFQVLLRISDNIDSQEKAKAKKDTSYKEKTFIQMEEDARKKVLKANDDLFKRYRKLDENDRLELYLNSISMVFDPHTEFFLPKDKETFDINMTGQLEGIGAQLQEKDGQIKVSNIVPGSASWRQGQLKAGDAILKVAQGTGEPVDLEGMRIDEAVKLIRGKKGTEVRLTVKKVDGTVIQIPIIRDIVVLEEIYAKGLILETDKKIGYIKLSSFYSPIGGNGTRYCSKDVKAELEKMKKENVAGVVLDLRYNGGGSLQDVVDMAGLFIERGPIVQVKSRVGTANVLEDYDANITYDGPLVIMVNYASASASEIMAAAIQDYRRGVIVGTKSTFGKGTVQRFFNLDDFLNPSLNSFKPLGSVKLTTQKFYRVSGTTTQLKGVVPDVVLPDLYSMIDQGEKEQDYPLASDEIPAAKYNVWKNGALQPADIRKKSEDRIKKSQVFSIISEEAQKLKKQTDKSLISLNLEKYRAEDKRNRDDSTRVKAIEKEITDLKVMNITDDLPAIEADTVKKTRNTEFIKGIKKDYQLYEAIAVLKDIK